MRYRRELPSLVEYWVGEEALPQAEYGVKNPDVFLIGQVMRILAFGRLIQARLNDVWAVDSQRVPDQSWLECLSNIAVVCTKNLQVVTVYRIGMSAAQ